MADKKLKNFLSLKRKKIKPISISYPLISKKEKLNMKFKGQSNVGDSSSKEEIDSLVIFKLPFKAKSKYSFNFC